MATYSLNKFAQPDVLKNIQEDRLLQFLSPHFVYLEERGFKLQKNGSGQIDYDMLCRVLMQPTEGIPPNMVDALYFVQEVADDEMYDELLKPTNDLAETHPCFGRCGGYMDVVKHGDGTYVGVCASGCDKRALQKKDLIVYSPDFNAIFSGLGRAFNVNDSGYTEIDGMPSCWQIGEYNPAASYRFPVVAMIEAQASRIERSIGQLAARFQKPFFVLLPSAPSITQSVQEVALRNGAKVFAYEDIIEFANDALQVRSNTASLLSELSAEWIKHIDGAHGETRYPTPAGATWGDIALEFTADEMVTVSCRNKDHRQYSAEDFNLRDKKTKKPKKAWAFLQALALENGVMRISDIEKVKKSKQEVSTNLQALFQLDSDPIIWSGDDTAYKCQFVVRGGDKLTMADSQRRRA